MAPLTIGVHVEGATEDVEDLAEAMGIVLRVNYAPRLAIQP